MIGLVSTATLYTEDPATGRFTVVSQTGIRCRRTHLNQNRAGTAGGRQELTTIRRLLFDPALTIPEEGVQIEMDGDGVRWNAVRGTFGRFPGPTGAVIYAACDLTRADDG